MTAIILSRPSVTGKALAEALEIPYRSRRLRETPDFVIRFGNTKVAYDGPGLNKREAIIAASNKKAAREKFREQGIPVPEPSETAFPVIGRPSHHQAGHDFFMCHNADDVASAKLRGATYFCRFYPKRKEYRIHVGSNRTLLVTTKEGDPAVPAWNMAVSGTTFRNIPRSQWLVQPAVKRLTGYAKDAVLTLGLDFGAVDIMADPSDNQPKAVVLEVNTAPSLGESAMRRYVKYFKEQMGVPE